MMPSPSKAYYRFHNANADRLMHRDGLLDGITGILDAVSPGDRVAILVLALFDGDYLLAKYLLDEYGEVELSFEPGERAFTYRHGEFDGSFEYSSVVNDWMCWLQDHQVDDFFALILRCKAYGLVGLKGQCNIFNQCLAYKHPSYRFDAPAKQFAGNYIPELRDGVLHRPELALALSSRGQLFDSAWFEEMWVLATQEMVDANPDDLRPFHPVRFVTLDTRSGEKQIPLHAFHSQELERTHIRSTYATWLPGFKEEKVRYLTDPIFDQQLKGVTLGLQSANDEETDLDFELLVKWTTDEMQCGLDARQVAGMVLCRSTASFLCQFPHLEASPVVLGELAGVLANRVPLKAGICRKRLSSTAAPPGSFHFAKNYSIPFIQSLMTDMHSLVVPFASVCSDDFFTQLIGIPNSSLLFARMLKQVLGMDVLGREVFVNPSRYEAEMLAVSIPAGVDVSFGAARHDTSDWAVATQAVCRQQEGACTIRGIPTDMTREVLISRFRASWANPKREPGHLDILVGLAKVEGQDSLLAIMERPDDWELAYLAFGPDVLRGREGELNARLQTLAAVDAFGL